MPLSAEDLAELDQIVIRLHNLTRRNGYPEDLQQIFGTAAAHLAFRRQEHEDAVQAETGR